MYNPASRSVRDMAPASRPRFEPSPCFVLVEDAIPALQSSISALTWTPVISCSAPFPDAAVSSDMHLLVRESLTGLALQFESALHALITQPEQNSTLILRAEILSDVQREPDELDTAVPLASAEIDGLRATRAIRRVLLPRRPGRDSGITQDCVYYSTAAHDAPTSCLVLTPVLAPGQSLPYYHPTVHHLAFRFVDATLRIEVVLLPDSPPLTLESRLYRTCLALLDTAHRYMWGHVSNWQKRVQHDILVPRDEYQDLYLIMRERHKHLVRDWKEETDPMKHVFEVRHLRPCESAALTSSLGNWDRRLPHVALEGHIL